MNFFIYIGEVSIKKLANSGYLDIINVVTIRICSTMQVTDLPTDSRCKVFPVSG